MNDWMVYRFSTIFFLSLFAQQQKNGRKKIISNNLKKKNQEKRNGWNIKYEK